MRPGPSGPARGNGILEKRSVPRFSIVIPTRNRSKLLISALRSALEQEFEDYEIVVSDNFSSDETREVVEDAASRRVRYVRTDRSLAMPESWEFALSHARGEYVTVLPDDDAISSRLLATVDLVLKKRSVPLLQWTGANYFDRSWPDPARRETLLVPTFTRRLVDLDSEGALRALFGLRGDRFPTLANSVCSRAVLGQLLERYGHLFYGYCPDHSGACVMLSQLDSYLYLDEILSVGGATLQSSGMTGRYNREGGFAQYIREFGSQQALTRVPLKMPLVMNILAETLLEVREALGGRLKAYALDWTEYFVQYHFELQGLERVTGGLGKEREELEQVLKRQPEPLQQAVRAAVDDVEKRRVTLPKVIDCETLGLQDILACVRYVDSLSVSARGLAKSMVLSAFGGRRGFRVARQIGRLAERCGLGKPARP